MAGEWRLAKSLEVLIAQIDKAHPKRNKAWDGTIGDASHQAGKSDHNPNDAGVVCAADITNDPVHDANVALIAEAIRKSREPRLSYMIHNGFMLRSYDKPGIPAWTWAPYTGPSAHEHHLHVSVKAAAADQTAPWVIS